MADLDELFRSVAGPPATADLEAIEARATRHRRARLAALGATVVVVVVLAAAGALVALGEDPGDEVVAGPPPAPLGCEPPAASDEPVPDRDVALQVAERFVAARAAGQGAQGCLSEDALAPYERAERFEGLHGEQAVACLYFEACPDGDRIEHAAVLGVGATVYGLHPGQHTGKSVNVQLHYRQAGVVLETLLVANSTRPDGTRVVLVVDMGLSPGALVSAAEAEQLVTGFLDALSAGHWESAAAFFTKAAVGYGDPGVDWESLLAAEPELAARHDVAGLLAAWCERHGGACLPVAEITGNTPFHGPREKVSREVTVRLRRPDGSIAVFADGSDQATFGVASFEGVTWIQDIPPQLAG